MKGKRFHIAVILIVGFGILLINACQQDDTTPPVVTVNGASIAYVSLNHDYADPGAVANDDKDGSVAVTSDYSSTNPDVNLAGTYTIHYSAADNAGNIGNTTRKVIVSNDAQNIAGIYNVNDIIAGKNAGAYNYPVTVIASTTVNNQLFLEDFSGLGGTITVTSLVSGNSITLTPVAGQTPSGMFDPGSISGSGAIRSDTITGFNYNILYFSTSTTDHGVSNWAKE